MNRQDNDNWLDEALAEVIGSRKPYADFEKWKNDHPDAVKMLTSRVGRQISATPGPLGMRSIIMRSPIVKLSAAAVAVIACLIGLSLWKGTESGIALADVLARIEQVDAYRYKWSSSAIGEQAGKTFKMVDDWQYTDLISQKYGFKSEQLNPEVNTGGVGTIEYFSIPQRIKVSLWPKDKRYWRTELDDAEVEKEALFLNENRASSVIKSILECKYESLGRSIINDIEVEGFRTTDPNCKTMTPFTQKPRQVQVDIRIWMDVKTRLPVRTEEDLNLEITNNNEVVHIQFHLITYDYEWDIPVDAAEFVPVIPDDYVYYNPLGG
ncbi:MAG: hypothetical protein JXN61_12185 [Sedimentisphaerales bacterium]|nr:hypothetical protein [Sedimentisphaerales bacterium]